MNATMHDIRLDDPETQKGFKGYSSISQVAVNALSNRDIAMTGSYDFILEVYGKDLEALSSVVLKKLIRVPNVRDLQSSVVLDTIKRTTRIPLGHLQT
jgi:DNA-binding Lrp family transcriptional regulator